MLKVTEPLDYILNNPEATISYIKSLGTIPDDPRFQKIYTEPPYAYLYCREILKNRWPEIEPIILKDHRSSYLYAEDILKTRWPEAEPTIMKNDRSALLYAYYVIKNRWPEAEKYIKTNPTSACHYTKELIKERWPEAEPTIKKNKSIWQDYLQIKENKK